jgi:hypothetical protein
VTPEQRIEARAPHRPVVQGRRHRCGRGKMERGIYEELLTAQSSEDRVRCGQRGRVRNFKKEMQIVVDRGEEVA